MYKCYDCGHIFEEPTEWEETHGLDTPPYEHWTGCHRCYGSYEEVEECEGCGGLYLHDELTDGLCEKCTEELMNEEGSN